MSALRRFVFGTSVLASMAACTPSESTTKAATGDDAALTQTRVHALKAPENEAVRRAFESASKAAGTDFYGYAAPFAWTREGANDRLTGPQLDALADGLVHAVREGSDDVPPMVDLRAVDVDDPSTLAAGTLRLDASEKNVSSALARAKNAGLRIARVEPVTTFAGAAPTAGAVIVVDTKNREALVLYGRRGPAPARYACVATTFHSYEWEESFTEAAPWVSGAEVPISGDVELDIGDSTFSNAYAVEDDNDYRVTTRREGDAVSFEAKGEFLMGKLVVDTKQRTGIVFGDRHGDGRPSKAAALDCTAR